MIRRVIVVAMVKQARVRVRRRKRKGKEAKRRKSPRRRPSAPRGNSEACRCQQDSAGSHKNNTGPWQLYRLEHTQG